MCLDVFTVKKQFVLCEATERMSNISTCTCGLLGWESNVQELTHQVVRAPGVSK